MAIPNKVTSLDQNQDGFRKVNQTIDNIVTGATFTISSSTLTLTKVNEQPINVLIPIFNHYNDYYYYDVFNYSHEVFYNFSDSITPLRDSYEFYSGFDSTTYSSVTSSKTQIDAYYNGNTLITRSGYYWKNGTFIGIGIGSHRFFLPKLNYEQKGYTISFCNTLPNYSGITNSNSNVYVYVTQNGIDTEPATLLKNIFSQTYLLYFFIWTGYNWKCVSWNINSSFSDSNLSPNNS